MSAPSRRPVVAALLGLHAVLALVVAGAVALPRLAERPTAALAPIELPPPALSAQDVAGCPSRGEPTAVGSPVSVPPATGRVTASAVLACPVAFDGARVMYVGEVVGDLLRRDGGAWALVNDDAYALEVGPLPAHRSRSGLNSGLSVWLPAPAVEGLGEPGRAGRRGAVIEVVGTLLRTDPADGGGLTLRAESVRVLAPGVDVDEPLDRPQAVAAALVLALAVGLRLARTRIRGR